MTDQNVNDTAEFVTEVAPTQKRKAGRPAGVKNGEGKTPAHKAAKLTAESVRAFGGVLYVHLTSGVTVRYTEGGREFDAGAGVLTAETVKALYDAAQNSPELPLNPSEVVNFGKAFGLGIEGFDALTVIRSFIVQ